MAVHHAGAGTTAAVNTPAYLRNARQIASQLAREDSATSILSELQHATQNPK